VDDTVLSSVQGVIGAGDRPEEDAEVERGKSVSKKEPSKDAETCYTRWYKRWTESEGKKTNGRRRNDEQTRI
jgi:hypothetical protein